MLITTSKSTSLTFENSFFEFLTEVRALENRIDRQAGSVDERAYRLPINGHLIDDLQSFVEICSSQRIFELETVVCRARGQLWINQQAKREKEKIEE